MYIILVTYESYIASYGPRDFNCIASSSRSLTCTWNHPQTDEYSLDHYRISYRLADGFDYYPDYGVDLGSRLLSSDDTQYLITNLLPYGGYFIELSTTLTSIMLPQDEVVTFSTTIGITDAESKNIPKFYV